MLILKNWPQWVVCPCFGAIGERSGSVVECRTLEREVGGSKPTAAVLCPWARHFTPRKYWLITQEAVAPSRHDWKIVDWDVKPQHKQNKNKASGLYTCKNIYTIRLHKVTLKESFFKFATNGQSYKAFLLASKVCHQGVVCPCPGAIYHTAFCTDLIS